MAKSVKRVEIEWIDSCGRTGIWESLDELEPLVPFPAVTIGYLLEKTKTHVTVAQTLNPECVARRFTIPLGCIKKIRRLYVTKS